MQFRQIFHFLTLLFEFANCCFCISFRTSYAGIPKSNRVYIAVDFQVPIGEHISANTGKGESMAPSISWKNAKVIDVFWPKSAPLMNSDGTNSHYSVYFKDFSLIYLLEIEELRTQIEYDLSYVICGDSCRPMQDAGLILPNNELSQSEIDRTINKHKKEDPKELQQEQKVQIPLIFVIFFGFIGGMILNFMPCVFPIVSMKIFSIIKSSRENPNIIKRQGFSFAAGNIFSFILIGVVLLLLRNSMPDIGWGFYMQEPRFVAGLLIAFLMCGLHFFGIYHLKIPVKRLPLKIKKAYVASFFNGMFGACASASCVGPFAGVAVASALFYCNFIESLSIFCAMGLGVASPFLLISLFPKSINFMPKPGKWLEIFKEFMGFTMLLSCVWLLWVLVSQIETDRVMLIIANTILISFFCWMFAKASQAQFTRGVSMIGLAGCAISIFYLATKPQENNETINWQTYSKEIFAAAINSDKPVFLNFTASWCLNCQFNHRVFADKYVVEMFKNNDIQAIKCDWSNRDKEISELLKSYGSVSVPFYVYYPAKSKEYKILPAIITINNLLDLCE
ncbi:hypothetical protein FACS1894113_3570 [Alphaproteobacteria bacterium]|nr:hypothetical protein FACS1894113_3570 [Alphaproteobacteria bacterium]